MERKVELQTVFDSSGYEICCKCGHVIDTTQEHYTLNWEDESQYICDMCQPEECIFCGEKDDSEYLNWNDELEGYVCHYCEQDFNNIHGWEREILIEKYSS